VNRLQSLLRLLQLQWQSFNDNEYDEENCDSKLQRELNSSLEERLIISELTSSSSATTTTTEAEKARNNAIARLSVEEFHVGRKLGEGRFGVIHELLFLRPSELKKDDCDDGTKWSPELMPSSSSSSSHHHHQHGYAVKRAHKLSTLNSARRMTRNERRSRRRQRLQNLVDFESELRILSSVHHPNIIRTHGILVVQEQHPSPQEGGATQMLVMERLYDTLEERLDTWRRSQLRQTYYSGVPLEDLDLPVNPKRLEIALDISCALDYLHNQRILHRDIKPSNLAFDRVSVVARKKRRVNMIQSNVFTFLKLTLTEWKYQAI